MTELLALGVSHKTAPVAMRERVALPDGLAEEFLARLVADPAVHEGVVISTCNRTEIYAVAGDPVAAESTVLGMLARHAGIRPTELAEPIYSLRNCDAARHLYRVTAGRVSVPSVAVDAAREAIGELSGRRVVILGTGEMAELTAQALAHVGVATIFVANRRRERAAALAQRFGGEVVPVDALPLELERADIVLASTSSPHHIVGHDELELVMRHRGRRPLLLIDIAVPRDVDPLCAQIAG